MDASSPVSKPSSPEHMSMDKWIQTYKKKIKCLATRLSYLFYEFRSVKALLQLAEFKYHNNCPAVENEMQNTVGCCKYLQYCANSDGALPHYR